MSTLAIRVRDFAALVKLSHSVFALPFALLALLTATAGRPTPSLLGWVVAAVVAARTAAMAYNRLVDRAIDAANPRTAQRELPRGAIRPMAAAGLCAAAAAVFLFACAMLGGVCLWLGPVVLAWLLGYSHAKRFTSWCHLWLGVALGLAPVAAWVAAEGAFTPRTPIAVLLGVGVAVWVAGFDVLYACQDEAFDRGHGLHSVPARFGARAAMWISRGMHLLAFACFAGFGVLAPLGPGYAAGLAIAAGLLVYQHRLLRPGDLSRIQMAFFTANGALAVVVLVAAATDLYGLWGAR